jgi:hypothetical protein
MGSTLSTPPAICAGTLADGPQPVLSVPGGLLLRPWEGTDAAVFSLPTGTPRSGTGILANPHPRTRSVSGSTSIAGTGRRKGRALGGDLQRR